MDLASLHAAIVDSIDAAIMSHMPDGKVLSWNPAAERIFGWAAGEIVGRSISLIVPEDRGAEENAILARVAAGEAIARFETERLRKDGSRVPIALMVSPVRDAHGAIIGASKIARDISAELANERERAQREALMRLMGDKLPVLVWVGTAEGRLAWANQGFREFFAVDGAALAEFRWQDHLEAGHGITAGPSEGPWEAVLPMRSASGAARWLLVRTVPLADPQGRPYLRFGTATDITDQHEAERKVRTLLKEVNHRTRNMLAVIQSLARRTVAGGGDFIERLEARIAGLAATQDLLVRHDWAGIPVAELVEAQVVAAGQRAERVVTAGPAFTLAPPAAEAIGMALAELTLNAARFGALSAPEGRVAVSWREGAADQFAIAWQERGGPRVAPPEISGFGSQIIVDVPRGKLLGTVELAYPPEGLSWRLTCPARMALAGDEA